MSEETPGPSKRRLFQFSLGSMLLLTTVAGLSIALVLMYLRMTGAERQLESLQPISPEEVARQFENATTTARITTKVDDVRYSRTEDAYKVIFEWTDKKTNTTWSTDVVLKADGFGAYFGVIRNVEFVQPFGVTEYGVVVTTPSPLEGK